MPSGSIKHDNGTETLGAKTSGAITVRRADGIDQSPSVLRWPGNAEGRRAMMPAWPFQVSEPLVKFEHPAK